MAIILSASEKAMVPLPIGISREAARTAWLRPPRHAAGKAGEARILQVDGSAPRTYLGRVSERVAHRMPSQSLKFLLITVLLAAVLGLVGSATAFAHGADGHGARAGSAAAPAEVSATVASAEDAGAEHGLKPGPEHQRPEPVQSGDETCCGGFTCHATLARTGLAGRPSPVGGERVMPLSSAARAGVHEANLERPPELPLEPARARMG